MRAGPESKAEVVGDDGVRRGEDGKRGLYQAASSGDTLVEDGASGLFQRRGGLTKFLYSYGDTERRRHGGPERFLSRSCKTAFVSVFVSPPSHPGPAILVDNDFWFLFSDGARLRAVYHISSMSINGEA
ncbi:hypothetical protein VTH06DRAFT_3828 [Thermothelomyces fergusii]